MCTTLSYSYALCSKKVSSKPNIVLHLLQSLPTTLHYLKNWHSLLDNNTNSQSLSHLCSSYQISKAKSGKLTLEWLYFCVLNFSRNAKDFDPFFAKFRENCERKKIVQFTLLLPLKGHQYTRILLGLIHIRISHKYMHLFVKL